MQRFLWSQLGHVIPRKFIVLFGQGRYCEGITHYLLVFSRSEDLFIYFSSTKERLPHFISVASRNKFLSGYFWIHRFVSALRRNLTIIFRPYIQKFPIKDPNIISTTSSSSLLIIKRAKLPVCIKSLNIESWNLLKKGEAKNNRKLACSFHHPIKHVCATALDCIAGHEESFQSQKQFSILCSSPGRWAAGYNAILDWTNQPWSMD